MNGFDSAKYWEQRYASGGNSGVGSYNDFAKFKAKVLNQFVVDNDISNVIEFGCGDGNQLSYSNYINYVGLDVSSNAVDICKNKFSNDDSKSFFLVNERPSIKFDLSLSLDVIYHLIEDDIFEKYMVELFDSSSKFVIVYSSNYNDNSDVNVSHVKHRKFTDFIDKNIIGWELVDMINNIYPYHGDYLKGSFSDFYIFRKK